MNPPFKLLRRTKPLSSTLSGILFMLAAMTIFSLVNVFSKMMVASCPPAQLFFIRGFGAIASLMPFLARDNFAAVRNVPRPGLQVLRMMLSVSDGMLFFTAIKYIPLADATTCYLAAPIFVTAFSAIFLREHVGWRRWSAVAAGFAGVLIALRPSGAAISWPALIALAGCLCQSMFMVVTRFVRGTSSIFLATAQVVGSFMFGGLVSAFMDKVRARWDMPAFDAAVRESQARRWVVYPALRNGAYYPWEFQPLQKASERYMRNHMNLDNLEEQKRFPRGE